MLGGVSSPLEQPATTGRMGTLNRSKGSCATDRLTLSQSSWPSSVLPPGSMPSRGVHGTVEDLVASAILVFPNKTRKNNKLADRDESTGGDGEWRCRLIIITVVDRTACLLLELLVV